MKQEYKRLKSMHIRCFLGYLRSILKQVPWWHNFCCILCHSCNLIENTVTYHHFMIPLLDAVKKHFLNFQRRKQPNIVISYIHSLSDYQTKGTFAIRIYLQKSHCSKTTHSVILSSWSINLLWKQIYGWKCYTYAEYYS